LSNTSEGILPSLSIFQSDSTGLLRGFFIIQHDDISKAELDVERATSGVEGLSAARDVVLRLIVLCLLTENNTRMIQGVLHVEREIERKLDRKLEFGV
jgi:hypothetical protein